MQTQNLLQECLCRDFTDINRSVKYLVLSPILQTGSPKHIPEINLDQKNSSLTYLSCGTVRTVSTTFFLSSVSNLTDNPVQSSMCFRLCIHLYTLFILLFLINRRKIHRRLVEILLEASTRMEDVEQYCCNRNHTVSPQCQQISLGDREKVGRQLTQNPAR